MVNVKMVNKSVLCTLCSVFLLVGCNKDNYLGGHFTEDYGGVQMELSSVIASNINPSLKWQAGDSIALTTSYTDNTSYNRFYVCQADNETFVPQTGIPIYIKGTGTLNAYAPVSGADGEETLVTVNTLNQSTLTDYLVAQSPISTASNQVELRFNHALAQLQIAFDVAEGEHVTKVQLNGLSHDAMLDLANSQWIVSEMTDSLVVTVSAIPSLTLNLLPQTASAVMLLTTDKREYSIEMGDMALTAGLATKVTVKADADGSSVAYSDQPVDWIDSGIGTNIESE